MEHNVANYTLGKGIVSIAPWVGSTPPTFTAAHVVGNCPEFSIEVTEESLPHYSSMAGARTKDKEVTLETGYTANFTLDEPTIENLAKFIRGSVKAGTSNQASAGTDLDTEYAINFRQNNPAGFNQTWNLWRCKIKPNGQASLIGDEWMTLAFMAEGLADAAHHSATPYFDVYVGTTTTS